MKGSIIGVIKEYGTSLDSNSYVPKTCNILGNP